MIIKQEVVLLCSKNKAWEIKDKGTSGISYTGLVYADKAVTNCKMEKDLFEKIKDMELQKGIAVIEILENSYRDNKGVEYKLREFGITK